MNTSFFKSISYEDKQVFNIYTRIDGVLHKDLLTRLKCHVEKLPAEGCIDAFLSNDGSYSQEVSDILVTIL
jgi:hypothetical protein